MTSPLVQIDGQHFNLGTFDAVRFHRFEEGKSLLFAQADGPARGIFLVRIGAARRLAKTLGLMPLNAEQAPDFHAYARNQPFP